MAVISRWILACGVLLTVLTTPVEAWADPILYEVAYDGNGADADDAFTELYGTPGMSLSGWSLRGCNGADGKVYRTISLTGAVIPSDGLLVIATSSAAGSVLLARDVTANVDWQNGPDAVQLLNASGTVVDALQYGDAGTYNAGEGTYATDVAAGWSLTRNALAGDTGNNANDFAALRTPTPGVGPPPAVPEPATLFLITAGGIGLASTRRRGRRGESPA